LINSENIFDVEGALEVFLVNLLLDQQEV
jgi:hypothetical protein